MNQSVKSLIALFILFTLGASVLGWVTKSGIEGIPGSRYWLRACTIPCVAAFALLIWADFRKEELPNFLRRVAGSYFERDGLSFSILPARSGDLFFWKILFQNRYQNACSVSIVFRPAVGNLGVRRPVMPEVHTSIQCEGAGFGSVIIPYGIPERYQGKNLFFEVSASTLYPNGRGKLLRFREGTQVGGRQSSGADMALTVAAGLSGHLHFHKSARFKASMPKDVLEHLPANVDTQFEQLWVPGQSESGVDQAAASNVIY